MLFLFGHDHSNGWDDYLGASSIYLAKGDNILIADHSQTEFTQRTLNFTYMNAGYTGYYDLHNTGADDALTMTVFRIAKSGSVTIGRFDSKGMHNLKSKGVTNAYKEEKAYPADARVYPSYQTVKPGKIVDSTPIKDLIKITDSGRQYLRVDDVADLKDGGKYLLVYNDTVDQLMKPQTVELSNAAGARLGFTLVDMYVFGEKQAYGKFGSLEWTFTKVGEKWKIGDGKQYVTFTKTQDKAVTATLTDKGNFFDIAGEATYSFASGDYFFNYNARGLMNGYTSDPAMFYIYEYAGYTVKVKDGDAMVDGKKVTVADVGTKITLKADAAPEGMFFDKWVVTDGKLTLQDPTAGEITFTMPEDALEITATYTDKDPNAKPVIAPADDAGEASGNGVIWIVVAVAAVIVVAAAVVVLRKRKKK